MVRQLRRAYLSVMAHRTFRARKRRARFLGYAIDYLSTSSFDYLFDEIFVGQEYLFRCDHDSPLILDLGSNIGMSVLYFKWLYPRSRIRAFEPDPQAFGCLSSNVAANRLGDVVLHNGAVSDSDRSIDFFIDGDSPGSLIMSAIPERMQKTRLRVNAVRLSHLLTDEVDFMKMDIEGAEVDVLRDLAETGTIRRVKQMAIEYHHHIVADRDTLSATLQALETSGFGYQVGGRLSRPFNGRSFQDLMIYAYRK